MTEYLTPDPTIRPMRDGKVPSETVDIGVPGDPEEQERTIRDIARDLNIPPDRPKQGRLRQKAWDRHYGPTIGDEQEEPS